MSQNECEPRSALLQSWAECSQHSKFQLKQRMICQTSIITRTCEKVETNPKHINCYTVFCLFVCCCCFCTPIPPEDLSHPKDFWRVCKESDSGEISGQAQSPAHNSHLSIWWPCLIMLAFWDWVILPLCAAKPKTCATCQVLAQCQSMPQNQYSPITFFAPQFFCTAHPAKVRK